MKSDRLLVGLIVCGLLIGCCIAGCTTTPPTNATTTRATTVPVTTGAGGAPGTVTSAATTVVETPGVTPSVSGTVTTVATTAPTGGETTAATLTPTVSVTPTPSGTEYIEQDSVPLTVYPTLPVAYTTTGQGTPVTTTIPVSTAMTTVPVTAVTTAVPITTATTPVPTTMVMTTIPTVTTSPPTTVTTATTLTPTQPITVATPVPTTPGSETIPLTAQNLAFSTSTITVRAGEEVTIAFNNMDAGVPHNFAVYTDSSASTAIFKGAIVTGPTTTTYTFTAPSAPGTLLLPVRRPPDDHDRDVRRPVSPLPPTPFSGTGFERDLPARVPYRASWQPEGSQWEQSCSSLCSRLLQAARCGPATAVPWRRARPRTRRRRRPEPAARRKPRRRSPRQC